MHFVLLAQFFCLFIELTVVYSAPKHRSKREASATITMKDATESVEEKDDDGGSNGDTITSSAAAMHMPAKMDRMLRAEAAQISKEREEAGKKVCQDLIDCEKYKDVCEADSELLQHCCLKTCGGCASDSAEDTKDSSFTGFRFDMNETSSDDNPGIESGESGMTEEGAMSGADGVETSGGGMVIGGGMGGEFATEMDRVGSGEVTGGITTGNVTEVVEEGSMEGGGGTDGVVGEEFATEMGGEGGGGSETEVVGEGNSASGGMTTGGLFGGGAFGAAGAADAGGEYSWHSSGGSSFGGGGGGAGAMAGGLIEKITTGGGNIHHHHHHRWSTAGGGVTGSSTHHAFGFGGSATRDGGAADTELVGEELGGATGSSVSEHNEWNTSNDIGHQGVAGDGMIVEEEEGALGSGANSNETMTEIGQSNGGGGGIVGSGDIMTGGFEEFGVGSSNQESVETSTVPQLSNSDENGVSSTEQDNYTGLIFGHNENSGFGSHHQEFGSDSKGKDQENGQTFLASDSGQKGGMGWRRHAHEGGEGMVWGFGGNANTNHNSIVGSLQENGTDTESGDDHQGIDIDFHTHGIEDNLGVFGGEAGGSLTDADDYTGDQMKLVGENEEKASTITNAPESVCPCAIPPGYKLVRIGGWEEDGMNNGNIFNRAGFVEGAQPEEDKSMLGYGHENNSNSIEAVDMGADQDGMSEEEVGTAMSDEIAGSTTERTTIAEGGWGEEELGIVEEEVPNGGIKTDQGYAQDYTGTQQDEGSQHTEEDGFGAKDSSSDVEAEESSTSTHEPSTSLYEFPFSTTTQPPPPNCTCKEAVEKLWNKHNHNKIEDTEADSVDSDNTDLKEHGHQEGHEEGMIGELLSAQDSSASGGKDMDSALDVHQNAEDKREVASADGSGVAFGNHDDEIDRTNVTSSQLDEDKRAAKAVEEEEREQSTGDGEKPKMAEFSETPLDIGIRGQAPNKMPTT